LDVGGGVAMVIIEQKSLVKSDITPFPLIPASGVLVKMSHLEVMDRHNLHLSNVL
jgi:hypothetical protein